ncbi:MAG TPA: ABC transporter substrate-binding protein [Burkholderiales bacterium]|nr:ABC transporter substrate-binding protein [Burkholderiales bacterium]
MLLLAFGLLPAAQAETAPDELVKSVTAEVIEIVKNDEDIKKGDPRKAAQLVQEKVLHHFNFTRMTALAMGVSWRQATPEQRRSLVDQFRTLLVRTYSTALTSYRDQTIDYAPLRMQPGDKDVTVRSLVRQPGAQPVTIDYRMEKTSDNWKVYDVAVGGVSLVTTYRDTFNTEVRNSGIDGLLKTLMEKNQQLANQSNG